MNEGHDDAYVLHSRGAASCTTPAHRPARNSLLDFDDLMFKRDGDSLGTGSLMMLRQTCKRYYHELLPAASHKDAPPVRLHLGLASLSVVLDRSVCDCTVRERAPLPTWVQRDTEPFVPPTTLVHAWARSMSQLAAARTPLHLIVEPDPLTEAGAYTECAWTAGTPVTTVHRATVAAQDSARLYVHTVLGVLREHAAQLNVVGLDLRGHTILDFTAFRGVRDLTVCTRIPRWQSRLWFPRRFRDAADLPALERLTLSGEFVRDFTEPPRDRTRRSEMGAFVHRCCAAGKKLDIVLERTGGYTISPGFMALACCARSLTLVFPHGRGTPELGMLLYSLTLFDPACLALRQLTVISADLGCHTAHIGKAAFEGWNTQVCPEHRVRLTTHSNQ